MSKNIDDEDFDKDIELAKLQVEATMWASSLSMLFGGGAAIIVGALATWLAYVLAYPNAPISIGEMLTLGVVFLLGGIVLWIARCENGVKQDEWKDKFKEISKRVKAEKAVHADKEPKP